MRGLLLALTALVSLLLLAGGASGGASYREWLTFNEVGLKGGKRLLSRHMIRPVVSSLSPDHEQLAYAPYVSDGARSKELWIADVRTARERLLVQAPGWITALAWAPNGRTIALTIHSPEQDPAVDGIWLVEVDGSNLRRVADGYVFGSPDWSPDSRHLVYVRADSVWSWLIVVLDVATGRARNLGQGMNPSFSPNGKKIVYEEACYHCLPSRIRVMSVASGVSLPIVQGQGFSPSWSPDGRQIAYLRFGRGGKQQLWLVRSTGGRARFLADRAHTQGLWSPNGQWIAFKRTLKCLQSSCTCRSSVRVVPVRGGSSRQLELETRWIVPLAWDRMRVLYQATKCRND